MNNKDNGNKPTLQMKTDKNSEIKDVIGETIPDVNNEEGLDLQISESVNPTFTNKGIEENQEFNFVYTPRKNTKRLGRNVTNEDKKVTFVSMGKNPRLVLACADGKEHAIEFANFAYETDNEMEIRFLRDALQDNLSLQAQIFEGKYPEWAQELMRKQRESKHKYSEDETTYYR